MPRWLGPSGRQKAPSCESEECTGTVGHHVNDRRISLRYEILRDLDTVGKSEAYRQDVKRRSDGDPTFRLQQEREAEPQRKVEQDVLYNVPNVVLPYSEEHNAPWRIRDFAFRRESIGEQC